MDTPDQDAEVKQPLSVTPLPHQRDLALRLADSGGQLAFHATGSGKTISAVNAAHEHNLPLLAVVPAALRNNFRKGIEDAGFKGQSSVVSYEEAVRRMNDPAFREQASKSLVAFDEAARMGQTGTARSDLASGLPAAKRLLLTGTPARNAPHELAPLINSAAGKAVLPTDPKEFQTRFLQTRTVPVGFFSRLMGGQGAEVKVPANLHEFEKAVRNHVHHYGAADRTHFPSVSESILEVPMSDRQQSAFEFVTAKYPRFMYKIRHGIPPSKSETGDMMAFLSGPRQVSNHPSTFNASATDEDAPKVRLAADEIQRRHTTDPNYRGVVYSAFLPAGIEPVSRELTRRGISHHTFTGSMDDAGRKAAIDDYNAGRTPVLLISGAGAEGLDLKGTKHMVIMEPHWHEEQIKQVKARGIRFKSHAHLPEAERHVEVQRLHSVERPGFMDRVLWGKPRKPDMSVDEYVYARAKDKEQVIEPFLRVMRGESAADVEKSLKVAAPINLTEPAFEDGPMLHVPFEHTMRPGFLIDLDGTVVNVRDWTDPHAQDLLPGVLEMLLGLQQKGYALVGVTNRSVYSADQSADGVMALTARTNEMLHGVLEDVICIPDGPSPSHKPAPDMLYLAMHRHGIDPEQCVMVGDSDDDKNAAANAGVGYVHPAQFFALSWREFPDAKDLTNAA